MFLVARCPVISAPDSAFAESVNFDDGSMLILVPAVSLKDQSLGVGQGQKTDATSH